MSDTRAWVERTQCAIPQAGVAAKPCRSNEGSSALRADERVIYTARRAAAVYVLHAFQKKTQATSKRDLDIAKARFAQIESR